MSPRVEELEPQALWRYFVELDKIPRCSKKEAAAVEWIAGVAAAHGVEAERDRVGNLLVRIPATPGCERAPAVLLQSHVDMVCEKDSDHDHDFSRDPIRPLVDGEFVRAQGTTLGADNGIGVATALAFLDAPDAVHGPLELLFTIDEETGLTGAAGIEPGFFSAQYMINLDSEKIGVFTVGCAGGRDSTLTFRAPRGAAPGAELLTVSVSGLQGGHSGDDIHKNRGNSIRILARALLAAAESQAAGAVRIGALSGGSKRNAIPREARAVVAIDRGRVAALREAIEQETEAIAAQLRGIDEGLRIECVPAPSAVAGDAGSVMTAEASLRMLQLLCALPNGVLAMSVAIPDLVETSNNVGVLTDLGDGYGISCSSRSSLAPAMNGVLAQIRAAGRLAGAEIVHGEGYPGWQPNLASPLLKRAKGVYRRLFGHEAQVRAIHAGLECGLLTRKYPDLDILSYGPEIQGAHSPNERVRIATVTKVWDFTRALLEDLTRSA